MAGDLPSQLRGIADEYPPGLRAGQRDDIRRIAFNIGLSVGDRPKGSSIADIGGGLGLFSVGCAAFGMRSVLVDDFRDPGNIEIAQQVLTVHRRHGVEVLERDVIADGLDLAPGSFDVITTFDSIEHWHHSPKRLLHGLVRALKPGGRLVIGAPNCVNLRKRLSVPLGIGKWSAMQDWYEEKTFRGHVREPDVADLRYMANDLGLQNVSVIGRNWLGYVNSFSAVRSAMPVLDRLLQPFPALCSDLYMVGHKK
ncbi:MAG: class I SAM-dependent methyltransferase [Alphaproteobacteria bacterium]